LSVFAPMHRLAETANRRALVLIVFAGAILRFATLGGQGLWFDELVTLDLAQRDVGDLLSGVQAGESNPALYYLLAGAWERVFGTGDGAFRSLSALIGTAVIPVVYLAARDLFSRRAGVFAAAFAAFSPILIWYSQEARNYELLVLFGALTFLCFVRALDERGQRWLWTWVVVSALALTTHYFSAFLIVAEATWLLARRPGPRLDTALPMSALAVIGLALAPLLASQRGRGSWIDEYDFGERLMQVPQHFLVGLEVPWSGLAVGTGCAVVLATMYALARAESATRRGVVVAGSIAFAAWAVVVLAAVLGSDYVLSRNLLGLWAPAAVAIAGAFAAPRAELVGSVMVSALAVLGVGLALWTAATPAAQRPQYPELAAALPAATQPRLIVSNSSFSAPLTKYLEGSRVATDTDLTTAELIVITPRPVDDYAIGVCWWIATCGGGDVEPPPPFDPPIGFESESVDSTEFFDYETFEAPTPTQVPRPIEYFTPRVFAQGPLP